MVRLKNIKKTDKYIEAYYIPEDTSEEGYLRINAETREDEKVKLTASDRTLRWYYRHTRSHLLKILNGEAEITAEKLIMWY